MDIKFLNECYEFRSSYEYCSMSINNKFLVYEFIIHKNILYENSEGNQSNDLKFQINVEKEKGDLPYSQQNLKKDKILIEIYSQNSLKKLKGSLIFQNIIEPNKFYSISDINTECLGNPDYSNEFFDFVTILVYFKYLF